MRIQNWKRHSAWLRRAVALLLALALLTGAALLPSGAAQTKEELEQKKEEVEDRIQQREEEIAQLKKDKVEQEKLISVLAAQVKAIEEKAALIDGEISSINASIGQLRTRIDALNLQINDCRSTIARIQGETDGKRSQIAEMQQQLQQRLRQQYMDGPVSNLQLLLSSPDLSSFLTMAEYIRAQAERDATLRSALESDMADLLRLEKEQEQQQATLETMRGTLEQETDAWNFQLTEQKRAKKELEAQHGRISDAQTELFTIINSLQKKTEEAQRLLAEDRRAAEKFEDMLDALLNEKKQNGTIKPDNLPIAEGKMIWPVPSSACYISSEFGDTQNRSYPHMGLDISASGANTKDYPIQAALDGEVVDFGYNSSKGNYVVLYHGYYEPMGKEIRATYMHLRSIDESIQDGAKIKVGKVIGIMGQTGNATGSHLHFQINEIGSDGKSTPVNPLKYVKNPY
ncbi:MAG: peptidoglycan DD-metalloendopeptidase family protein [Oscillospiraceae bacterium]|jgi:murein DD-endopeptidase MepM/ murein hydrolase activator NlpD|nr:peptidoglycan DD-metalloendopeptidase family protein [Oscillospiraceae bacterium]